MQLIIEIQTNKDQWSGFTWHNWILINGNKTFYLGQDVKVCKRLLGCNLSDLINEVAKRLNISYDQAREIEKKEIRECIANIIIEFLEIDDLNNLESWQLAVQ